MNHRFSEAQINTGTLMPKHIYSGGSFKHTAKKFSHQNLRRQSINLQGANANLASILSANSAIQTHQIHATGSIKARKSEKPKTVTLNLVDYRSPTSSTVRRWQSLDRDAKTPLLSRIITTRSGRKISRNIALPKEHARPKFSVQNEVFSSLGREEELNQIRYIKPHRRKQSIPFGISLASNRMETSLKRESSGEFPSLSMSGEPV